MVLSPLTLGQKNSLTASAIRVTVENISLYQKPRGTRRQGGCYNEEESPAESFLITELHFIASAFEPSRSLPALRASCTIYPIDACGD